MKTPVLCETGASVQTRRALSNKYASTSYATRTASRRDASSKRTHMRVRPDSPGRPDRSDTRGRADKPGRVDRPARDRPGAGGNSQGSHSPDSRKPGDGMPEPRAGRPAAQAHGTQVGYRLALPAARTQALKGGRMPAVRRGTRVLARKTLRRRRQIRRRRHVLHRRRDDETALPQAEQTPARWQQSPQH